MSLDNYPPGAANDSSAPYNEKAQYGIEFNCIATQTLTMATKISTNQYTSEEDWELPLRVIRHKRCKLERRIR